MNIKTELEQIHSKIMRASNPITHMIVKRKYWGSNIEETLLLLNASIKQVEELKEAISRSRE